MEEIQKLVTWLGCVVVLEIQEMACWENAEETQVRPELGTMQTPSLKVREEMDVHQEILEASVSQRNKEILKQSNPDLKTTPA